MLKVLKLKQNKRKCRQHLEISLKVDRRRKTLSKTGLTQNTRQMQQRLQQRLNQEMNCLITLITVNTSNTCIWKPSNRLEATLREYWNKKISFTNNSTRKTTKTNCSCRTRISKWQETKMRIIQISRKSMLNFMISFYLLVRDNLMPSQTLIKIRSSKWSLNKWSICSNLFMTHICPLQRK